MAAPLPQILGPGGVTLRVEVVEEEGQVNFEIHPNCGRILGGGFTLLLSSN